MINIYVLIIKKDKQFVIRSMAGRLPTPPQSTDKTYKDQLTNTSQYESVKLQLLYA